MTENETVTVKAILDEQGNGLFPSDSLITTHNGKQLKEYIDRCFLLKDGYVQDENGIIPIDMKGASFDTIKYTGSYYINNISNVPEDENGFLIVESIGAHVRYTWKPSYLTNGNVWTCDITNNNVGYWKQITETHTGITYMNGWINNGLDPILTKIGNIVWLNAIIRKGTNIEGTIMLKIPDGYRPVTSLTSPMICTSGNGLAIINSDGNITISTPSKDVLNVQIVSMWSIK